MTLNLALKVIKTVKCRTIYNFKLLELKMKRGHLIAKSMEHLYSLRNQQCQCNRIYIHFTFST